MREKPSKHEEEVEREAKKWTSSESDDEEANKN